MQFLKGNKQKYLKATVGLQMYIQKTMDGYNIEKENQVRGAILPWIGCGSGQDFLRRKINSPVILNDMVVCHDDKI